MPTILCFIFNASIAIIVQSSHHHISVYACGLAGRQALVQHNALHKKGTTTCTKKASKSMSKSHSLPESPENHKSLGHSLRKATSPGIIRATVVLHSTRCDASCICPAAAASRPRSRRPSHNSLCMSFISLSVQRSPVQPQCPTDAVGRGLDEGLPRKPAPSVHRPLVSVITGARQHDSLISTRMAGNRDGNSNYLSRRIINKERKKTSTRSSVGADGIMP